jgi:hypothetical protein
LTGFDRPFGKFMTQALQQAAACLHGMSDGHHHHHQITKLSHSINAIGPAPHRMVKLCPLKLWASFSPDGLWVKSPTAHAS